MANNKMNDYWFMVEGKMTFLKIREDIAEDYIINLCGREPDAWGEFHEIVDKRDEPIVDYCDDEDEEDEDDEWCECSWCGKEITEEKSAICKGDCICFECAQKMIDKKIKNNEFE